MTSIKSHGRQSRLLDAVWRLPCLPLLVSALTVTRDALRVEGDYTVESLVRVQNLREVGAEGTFRERLREVRTTGLSWWC